MILEINHQFRAYDTQSEDKGEDGGILTLAFEAKAGYPPESKAAL